MNPTLSLLRVSALSFALLSSSVVVADTGAAAKPGAAQATGFSGKFTAAATDAEKKARQKSVDTTVNEFPDNVKPIAKDKLEIKTKIPAWVDIKQAGGKVTFHFDGRKPEECPLAGSSKGKDPDGNDASFEARLSGDTLVQTITTEEGKRVNTFKLQSDGSVKLSVELTSVKFKTPIAYTLSYAKGK
ncbi:MAG: hypothetical protein RLZZ450_6660 [Pseudomonadota bacterium]|jgi:hypothetical protein